MQVISEDFKKDGIFSRNFILFLTLQNVSVVILLFSLQQAPVTQTLLYTSITLAYIILVLNKRPFEKNSGTLLFVVNNFIKLMMGIIAFVLAIDDANLKMNPREQINLDMRLKIAYSLIAMIAGGIIFNILFSLITSATMVFKRIKNVCNKKKESEAKQKKRKSCAVIEDFNNIVPHNLEQSSILDLQVDKINNAKSISSNFQQLEEQSQNVENKLSNSLQASENFTIHLEETAAHDIGTAIRRKSVDRKRIFEYHAQLYRSKIFLQRIADNLGLKTE